jgi:hypothetical protein
MQEYDLSPDELIAKAFRLILSSHPGYHPYTKKGRICRRSTKTTGGEMFLPNICNTIPPVIQPRRCIFGNWDKALQAAGFDPDKMRLQGSLDRQKIIKKLQDMRDRNLPLYAHYILKNHTALFSSSRREFGSWRGDFRAAILQA